MRGWDRKGAGRWVPRSRLLGRNFNAHDFLLLWLEGKDDLHPKHHFAITTLTRARPAPADPTFPFSLLLCTHSCLSVSSKKNVFWLGWKGEIFLLLYIYIKF